jgi:micrococcal nuclease
VRLAALLLLASLSLAADRRCLVVGVTDGDTLTVRCGKSKQEKVRLAEVDAPEKRQPFGSAAKARCSELAYGKEVTLVGGKKDRYGRTVAGVLLPGGESLGRALIRDGFAWWYKEYSKDPSLGALEEEARNEKRGLWKDELPVRPAEFRRPKKAGV